MLFLLNVNIHLDVDYMWILWHGKFFRQFSLLTWNSFISQFVHLVEGEGMWYKGWKHDACVTLLKNIKFWRKIQVILCLRLSDKIIQFVTAKFFVNLGLSVQTSLIESFNVYCKYDYEINLSTLFINSSNFRFLPTDNISNYEHLYFER